MEGIVLAAIITSVLSFCGTIISLFFSWRNTRKNNEFKTQISTLQVKLNRGTYVSKVVFNQIFKLFQDISICLFDNYNNAMTKLFPILNLSIPLSRSDKVNEMLEYHQQAIEDLNKLITLTQTNRFILINEIIDLLKNFEEEMRYLISQYESKIQDAQNDSAKFIDLKDLSDLSSKAINTMNLSNLIEDYFKKYIDQLQIID